MVLHLNFLCKLSFARRGSHAKCLQYKCFLLCGVTLTMGKGGRPPAAGWRCTMHHGASFRPGRPKEDLELKQASAMFPGQEDGQEDSTLQA